MKSREIILRCIQLMVFLFLFFVCVFSVIKCSIDMQIVVGISVLICFVVVFTMIEGIISIGRDVEEIKKKLTREKP